MPGGAAAIWEPWRMAAAYLDVAFEGALPDNLDVMVRNRDRWNQVLEVARAGLNSPLTSSAGRLFDAVAAIVGVRDAVNYEGQAAIELEQRANTEERAGYPAQISLGMPFRIRGTDLIRAIVEDARCGVEADVISARFHNGIAEAIVCGCQRVRETTSLDVVALSGGVFQNMLLLGHTVALLRERGFRVLVHSRVPPNDGGISLGQAAVAGALDEMRAEGKGG
jgi:hydrogenase maturation protein HypF